MDECCRNKEHEIAQLRGQQARVLKIVLAINAVMFLIEFTAGVIGGGNVWGHGRRLRQFSAPYPGTGEVSCRML
jgi:hypothetical protein